VIQTRTSSAYELGTPFNQTKTNEKVVPFIQEYFEVSKLQASEYYNMMTTDELKLLLKQYGKADKEIKKMGVK